MIPVASIERVGRLTYSLGQKLKEQEAEGTYHHNEHEDDREIHSTQTETPKNPFDHNRAIFPSDISKIQI